MTTSKQTRANQNNAKKSTGPKSEAGKAIVARNAVRHGAYSVVPVIPEFERAEDWEEHRKGITQSLAPVGRLESILAERVALLLWRLDRLTRYETNLTAIQIAEAEEPVPLESLTYSEQRLEEEKPERRLPKLEQDLESKREIHEENESGMETLRRLRESDEADPIDGDTAYSILATANEWVEASGRVGKSLYLPGPEEEEFLEQIGVPREDSWDDVEWTAELVTRGLEHLAKLARVGLDELIEATRRQYEKEQSRLGREIADKEGEAEGLRGQRDVSLHRKRTRQSLLVEEAEARITRCESHLTRQMFQTLHELQRLQAARDGQAVPAPAAVEVGVNISDGKAG